MSILTSGKVVASKEEGLEHLRNFPIAKPFTSSYNYAMLFEEEDGTFKLYERVGMPCWGALREYQKGTRPNDPWPEDLRGAKHKFPETGKPIAVAAYFNVRIRIPKVEIVGPDWMYSTINPSYWNKFVEFVFNPEISPWKGALKGIELVKNENDYYQGCVFTDTNIDPNIMIALLRCNANSWQQAHNWGVYLDSNPDIDPRVAYLQIFKGDGYYFNPRIILKNFFNGEPVDISAGGTFYERESYNRPDIQFIFGGKDNTGILYNKMTVEELTNELKGLTA